MKAEDTVINLGQMQNAIWIMGCKAEVEHAEVTNRLRFEAIASAQAEITWDKAIREVIKYLVSDDNGLQIEMRGPKWGKQLKKWGLA